ncbi:hypothetical protein [Chloroherpeton thalassium]|nr:hypothetical protein [Chloroherpeton thalassium]
MEISTKFVLQEKEAFEKNSEARLKTIRGDIEDMKAALSTANETASEIQAQLNAIEKKEAELEAWLEKMETDDALQGAQQGFHAAMAELEKAKENLEKRLK